MTEDLRPVWLSRSQRDLLNDFLITEIVDAWDAAPADPTEAITWALCADSNLHAETNGIPLTEPHDWCWEARTALRALGCAKEPA